MDEIGTGIAVGFLMEGTGACPLVGGADSYPSGVWGFVSVRLEGLCAWRVFRQTVCQKMGGAVIPPGLLFGLRLLSPDGWCHVFLKWQPPGELMLMIIP